MGWFQKGDGKHDRVSTSSSNKTVSHIKYNDSKGGKATVSETKGGSGKNNGHTTVHGSGQVNKHGSHK